MQLRYYEAGNENENTNNDNKSILVQHIMIPEPYNDSFISNNKCLFCFDFGDFKQLPPVPDTMHLDPGDYCFQSEEFVKALPHRVILKQV